MVHWYWLIVALCVGAVGGGWIMAICAAGKDNSRGAK